MSLQIERADGYAVLSVAPEGQKLDSMLAPQMKSELVILSHEGFKNIIVDLSSVRYCDSSGLSAILVGNRLCRDLQGSFVLCGLQPMVQKLITISQLDTILSIVPTLDEARQYIAMEEVERQVNGE